MDLSNHKITKSTQLAGLSKLKRVNFENNELASIYLKGLSGLEYLSLANNRLEKIFDCVDLKKLVYLDLGGNRLSGLQTNLIEMYF